MTVRFSLGICCKFLLAFLHLFNIFGIDLRSRSDAALRSQKCLFRKTVNTSCELFCAFRAMQIFFRSKKLQKTCSSAKEVLKAFGAVRGKKLQQRLLELQAADHLGQISRLPPARCHEMTGNRQGQLSVDLDHPYRLFFIPADDPDPRKPDGGLDWDAVTAIEIVDIADPH